MSEWERDYATLFEGFSFFCTNVSSSGWVYTWPSLISRWSWWTAGKFPPHNFIPWLGFSWRCSNYVLSIIIGNLLLSSFLICFMWSTPLGLTLEIRDWYSFTLKSLSSNFLPIKGWIIWTFMLVKLVTLEVHFAFCLSSDPVWYIL